MTSLLDTFETTAEVPIPSNPLDMIIGQDHAIALIRTAVMQRRHVLLCGVPGIGKSMIAKAAHSLLPPPRSEIRICKNPDQPDRPRVREEIVTGEQKSSARTDRQEVRYIRPDDLPFDVAAKMGYRCQHCGSMSVPSQYICMDCGYPKRVEIGGTASYVGLMRALDVVSEPALTSVTLTEEDGTRLTFRRSFDDTIMIVYDDVPENQEFALDEGLSRILISRTSDRFVRVSGFSPVELLGDVKHDPYGSAESLGMEVHLRVVPGAIHEAHEGILYIDELAALGEYQKHLLTAMQDKKYPIAGHNPQSSGAAVRVDDVPCDFILFAACNIEDLPRIIPPLRSRIRGYGYEIMLNSWMPKNDENITKIARFVAQTVSEDGKIPHFTAAAVRKIVDIAEETAFKVEGLRNALTLRLRELGGVVRIAGDIAVQDEKDVVDADVVTKAIAMSGAIDLRYCQQQSSARKHHSDAYGDYFF